MTETESPIATTRSQGKKQRLEEQEAEENKNKREGKKKQVIGKRKRVVKEKKEVKKKEKVAKRKGKKKLEDEDDMDDEEAVVEKKKAKGRGKKKVEEEEEEEDEDEGSGKYFKSLRAKTTVKPFYKATHKLSPERKQRVREMGFGSLLDFPFDKIPTKLPYFILKILNVDKMEVKLPNGGVLKITPRKIREVLGIPMGPIPFYVEKKTLTKDSVYCKFMAQLPKNIRKRTTIALSETIQKSERVDFIFELSYLTLFANCFGSCNNTAMLKDDVLENVKSSKDIPNIDWCTLIWDYIKGSKEKWDDRMLENWYYGPHVTFTLIYLHYTEFDEMDAVKEAAVKEAAAKAQAEKEAAEKAVKEAVEKEAAAKAQAEKEAAVSIENLEDAEKEAAAKELAEKDVAEKTVKEAASKEAATKAKQDKEAAAKEAAAKAQAEKEAAKKVRLIG
ncbi:hypothetical protein CTI12_AA065470 [Artemisia annua]|uniref:Uncharacterized protein n=1 Tax=Artemisia annua TaxID=35608 RepID=A0A2U1Q7E8_ARTAN|nr:hypothetical protein CTI12_AA065470 [Artemisia annua]